MKINLYVLISNFSDGFQVEKVEFDSEDGILCMLLECYTDGEKINDDNFELACQLQLKEEYQIEYYDCQVMVLTKDKFKMLKGIK